MDKVLVEVSARHVHLTRSDVDVLFGKGYELTVDKYLSQPGQFLAKEKVKVIGPKKTFERVGIIGPIRKHTQFELSKTDTIALGITGVLRNSGDVDGTPGFEMETENGHVVAESGAIIAKRHIHMLPEDAECYNVTDGEEVSIRIENGNERTTVFENVTVRVTDTSFLAVHIDTDEANAAFVNFTGKGELIKK